MFRLVSFIFLIAFSSRSYTQKKPITLQIIKNWPVVERPIISNDGKYIAYTTTNMPAGSSTVTIKALNQKWQISLIGATNINFTNRNNAVICLKADTLIYQYLGSSKVEKIPSVSNYSLCMNKDHNLIIIRKKYPKNDLWVYEMNKKKYKKISHVKNYYLNPTGKSMVIKTTPENVKIEESLEWLNLSTLQIEPIHSGNKTSNEIFDKSGKNFAFTIENKVFNKSQIGYFKYGKKKELKTINLNKNRMDTNIMVASKINQLYFSNNSQRLFMRIEKVNRSNDTLKTTLPIIWRYNDPTINYQDKSNNRTTDVSLYVVDLTTLNYQRLTFDHEKIISSIEKNDKFLIVDKTIGDINESFWNTNYRSSKILVYSSTGERTLLLNDIKGNTSLWSISPNNKFVLYAINGSSIEYYTYEIKTGITRNISKKINAEWNSAYSENLYSNSKSPIGVIGWYKEDESILIKDRYDIWKIDPMGVTLPKNITHMIGKNTGIIFYPAINNSEAQYTNNDHILLKAFNVNDKTNGFYDLSLRGNGNLTKLTMDPCLYSSDDGIELYSICHDLIKSKDAKIYLIKKENETVSPNYFYTKDFKTFIQVTHIHPEKQVNWFTSEIHRYRLPDGRVSEGILYKPENFDSTKKYPLIFNYYFYSQNSNNQHAYLKPKLSISANINIPYYVSNEYLVFIPNIIRDPKSTDKLKETTINAVKSASAYLTKLNWIDSTKLGINGHSQGGLQTNYLISISNKFAAAVSGAGNSDLISLIGSLRGGAASYILGTEIGQMYGIKLSDNPIEYLKYSPIVYSKDVTTPLLILHNRQDKSVNFSQGVELFMALRRLNKRVWMIQYDGEGHVLQNNQASLDFTIKMKGYYDHFLKGASNPNWLDPKQ